MKLPRKQVDIEALAHRLHNRMIKEMSVVAGIPLTDEQIEKSWVERPAIPGLWKAVAEEAVAWMNT